MLDYARYTAEDFTRDDRFRQWVFSPTNELNGYWEEVLQNQPDKQEDIIAAKALLSTLIHRYPDTISEQEVEDRVNHLAFLITGEVPGHKAVNWWAAHWWKLAASIVFIVTVAYLAVMKADIENELMAGWFPNRSWTITKINKTDKVLTLLLPDSSVISLEPGSKLSFPSKFDDHQRKVVLEGNAFFEVKSSKTRPFFVYTESTITKVLGTSFKISTLPDKSVKIMVKTGQVMVFRNVGDSGNRSSNVVVERPVFLLPEQEVSIKSVSQGSFTVDSVKNTHEAKIEVVPLTGMIYEDAPVIRVFGDLEEKFGVRISYDREALKHCLITSTFTDETLIERVNFICVAVGISYSPDYGNIRISGKGCTDKLQ